MRSQSRVPIQTLQDARDSITSLETNAGGGLAEILVGSVDGCVRAYDVRMGEMVEDTIGASVTSIVLSASGRRQGETYAVASLDSKIRLMDRSNGQVSRVRGQSINGFQRQIMIVWAATDHQYNFVLYSSILYVFLPSARKTAPRNLLPSFLR